MNELLLRLHVWMCTCALPDDEHDGDRRDVGQATTEYALVMLGAAAIALLVITWATAGGGAGKVGRLFDRVLDGVIGRI
jgi:hypothetical protein